MYSVIVSFGVISLLFPFFIVKGLFGAYATLLSDFINLGISASLKALNIIFVLVMRILPLSGS